MKLLSPVADMISLQAAVAYGADEVYLGVNRYNARNNVDSFTLDTLPEAVDYAHLFGVKVNMALNILFSDEEMEDALETARLAYNAGVDALIVQDLGLASLLHTLYPDIPLHASTQMGLHNLEGVQAVLPYGFTRVILARETPLAEVRRIKDNVDIEIEYFVQGALCVCFSGNCYLSERLLDASGNRGKCKQLCRLPYTLERDGKAIKTGYLLSAKDFNLVKQLPKLQRAGVDVLKIEGRARRAAYVAAATATYRKALDGEPYDEDAVRLAFNRLYTPAYFEGNGDVISPYNNHIGIPIGKVEKVNRGNKFNEVFFSSSRPVNPKSVLKIYQGTQEVNTLSAYDLHEVRAGLYRTTTTQRIEKGGDVHLISDPDAEAEALQVRPRRPVGVCVSAQVGKPITAYLADFPDVAVEGGICLPSQNQPITEESLAENFAKSDYFDVTLRIDALDKVFLPKKDVNALRRDLFDRAFAFFAAQHKRNLAPKAIPVVLAPRYQAVSLVETADAPIEGDVVVYSPATYRAEDVARFVERCREMGATPYLHLPNFALQEDIALLRAIVTETGVGIVADNYYALGFAAPTLIGHGLNVYNRYTAEALAHTVLAPSTAQGILSPYMTLRHCPMQAHLGGDCSRCPFGDGYVYVMDNGTRLALKRKKLSTCTFYLV